MASDRNATASPSTVGVEQLRARLLQLLQNVPPWSMRGARDEALLSHQVVRRAIPPGWVALVAGAPRTRTPSLPLPAAPYHHRVLHDVHAELRVRVRKGPDWPDRASLLAVEPVREHVVQRLARLPIPKGATSKQRREIEAHIQVRAEQLRAVRKAGDPVPIDWRLADLAARAHVDRGAQDRGTPLAAIDRDREVAQLREHLLRTGLCVLEVLLSPIDERELDVADARREIVDLVEQLGDELPSMPEAQGTWRALLDDPLLELRSVSAALATFARGTASAAALPDREPGDHNPRDCAVCGHLAGALIVNGPLVAKALVSRARARRGAGNVGLSPRNASRHTPALKAWGFIERKGRGLMAITAKGREVFRS